MQAALAGPQMIVEGKSLVKWMPPALPASGRYVATSRTVACRSNDEVTECFSMAG
jgi:hypothetical protein